MILETYTTEETYKIGEQLGREAKKGQVFCLTGDLGVGKTVFSKGFATGLGITQHISSPTYTIVHEYDEDKVPFYHFDVYRIEDVEEMEEIGYEEYFYSQGISLVEWADKIKEIIPQEAIWIKIEKDLEKGLEYRKITID
ncbi:tRNA threonylcarbamoyladenosine biosynthesis protein TsaE [Natranaerovirga hydrolytica]|uniref:tRNA threonylcarbamoyladenosine biosynthesis protein TsaE n=1 Tax=Natranaerovirga hydrolytica TaxID=680378 RepID=A0A4V2PZ02_9FIRM|nr:tRNA (adenosine(37)-N6)-threonylcarbamoyltransferase complex ATPase subunit type 1 TsaE [Natranaerovirga hydrolytica]TCK87941.1 tRNA threonylcarbamoyladenosine biosynthesis protein TsaE [Natranaerovirga hydrolytica]